MTSKQEGEFIAALYYYTSGLITSPGLQHSPVTTNEELKQKKSHETHPSHELLSSIFWSSIP
jgi:hypothetical protein